MYNIGICDDGENICASVENMLLKYAEKKAVQVDVQVWYTGEKLRDYLARGNHLDILFLDIELFKMTGIEVGNYIRNVLDNMGLQVINSQAPTKITHQNTCCKKGASHPVHIPCCAQNTRQIPPRTNIDQCENPLNSISNV